MGWLAQGVDLHMTYMWSIYVYNVEFIFFRLKFTLRQIVRLVLCPYDLSVF